MNIYQCKCVYVPYALCTMYTHWQWEKEYAMSYGWVHVLSSVRQIDFPQFARELKIPLDLSVRTEQQTKEWNKNQSEQNKMKEK